MLKLFSRTSTLLEPTTTLSTTSAFASIIDGTLRTRGQWFEQIRIICTRGSGARAGGSYRTGGSCCSGSTGTSQEALPPRMLKFLSRASTLQEPTTTLSTTSASASIIDDTLRTRGPRIRFGINFTGGSCCSGGAAFATSTWIDGCTPP